jgi:tRNA threonylcarbamoyladenosine biosynthesis protein TsaB
VLLAIDTASRFISLALHDGYQLHFESTWHTLNNHTIELAPAIRQAFQQTQIGPADLTAVAVSQGPGSFTGLRIGLGVAKGLAMAQHLALVAVPTLEIVAAGVPGSDGALVAVLQAGRGRICAQRFRREGGTWIAAAQAEITHWSQLVDEIRQKTLLAGEVDDVGRATVSSTDRPVQIAPGACALRRAGYLAEIAWSRVRSGKIDDPASVTPIYLHQPGVPHP